VLLWTGTVASVLAAGAACVAAWAAIEARSHAVAPIPGAEHPLARVAKGPPVEAVQPAQSTPVAVGAPAPLAEPPTVPRGSSAGPPDIGQSIGNPRDGALFGGDVLEAGPGYMLRSGRTAYATREAVAHIRSAIAKVREKNLRLHPLVVGDLSSELGGRLLGHRSHHSGRDVDLGLFYRKRSASLSRRFVYATRDNLHFRGTLDLIQALYDTRDEPGGAEWILLDYRIQRMLVRWAKNTRFVPASRLEELFQFPAGPTSEKGFVRHFPGHRNHMHVRFACPPGDEFCASPAGPPRLDGTIPPTEAGSG
jgi:murein endopeptidase